MCSSDLHPVINVSRLRPFREVPEHLRGSEVVPPEALPLPVPADYPFLRVSGFLATTTGRGRPRELLVQWVDLPEPSWVEAKLLQAECQRAYGNDRAYQDMLKRVKRVTT